VNEPQYKINEIVGLKNVTKISAGAITSYALTNGQVYTWGGNMNG